MMKNVKNIILIKIYISTRCTSILPAFQMLKSKNHMDVYAVDMSVQGERYFQIHSHANIRIYISAHPVDLIIKTCTPATRCVLNTDNTKQ